MFGGYIRVIRPVDGNVSERHRRAWVGCVLPYWYYNKNKVGYLVPQDMALAVLAGYSPEAEESYRARGFPYQGGGFLFEAKVVEPLP